MPSKRGSTTDIRGMNMAQRIDANAQSILDEVKKEMNMIGIKSPSYSDAIRYLNNSRLIIKEGIRKEMTRRNEQ